MSAFDGKNLKNQKMKTFAIDKKIFERKLNKQREFAVFKLGQFWPQVSVVSFSSKFGFFIKRIQTWNRRKPLGSW